MELHNYRNNGDYLDEVFLGGKKSAVGARKNGHSLHEILLYRIFILVGI